MLTGKCAVHFHALDLGNFPVLLYRPQFFEDFVELLLVGHGENFLVGNLAVMQFDAAVGQAGDYGVVRDHHDGASLAMQFAQQAQDDLFVDRIQIAGGLVGQNDFRIVDQGARDAHPLLLAAGELGGQMPGAVFQAHVGQRRERLLLVGHAVKVLRQHDVFERGQVRNQVELLEDEADFFRPGAVQILGGNAGPRLRRRARSRRRWDDRGSRSDSTSVDLPEPEGPMTASHSPGVNFERDIIQGADDAAASLGLGRIEAADMAELDHVILPSGW